MTSLSLSCIGEGNGNPLQCSCLENPRDGGAWWAAIYGVAQSRTRWKRLSSSSSRLHKAKNTPANTGDAGSILGWEDPVEEEMTTCSSILVWEIPWSLVGYSPWGHKESDTTEGLNHNTLPQRLLQRGDSATLPGSHEP